ncbi:MAG: ribosomal protein S18-alanine N-acetyltransferase [Oscillospiraceae bacterium]|nr:ribosomal protein S18-alanine N-acetyltransferase [Oscillospiraceae bacterium]
MFKIRLAGKDDIKALEAIDRLCAEQPWSERQFSEELRQPHARLLAAEAEQELVGFCDLHIIADDAHINELAVLPSHRRLGAARALVKEALTLARNDGCVRLTLEVRSKNAPAIALYESCGLKPCGLRRGFYREPDDDALTMLVELKGE